MIRQITVLAGVTLAILLGPRIVHAEENQSLLSQKDSDLNLPTQQLTGDHSKMVDVLQTPKDIVDDSINRVTKINAIDHSVKSVKQTVNETKKAINQVNGYPSDALKKTKDQVEAVSGLHDEKKVEPTPIHKVGTRDKHVEVKQHRKTVRHHHTTKIHHQHHSSKKNDQTHHHSLNLFTQQNDRSNPIGNNTNTYSNSLNAFGYFDRYWVTNKVKVNQHIDLHDRRRTQWENAPPTPPPNQPLHNL